MPHNIVVSFPSGLETSRPVALGVSVCKYYHQKKLAWSLFRPLGPQRLSALGRGSLPYTDPDCEPREAGDGSVVGHDGEVSRVDGDAGNGGAGGRQHRLARALQQGHQQLDAASQAANLLRQTGLMEEISCQRLRF